MIRRLEIQNFRCLRSVAIDLEALTVFVGANASGKSSVFAALQQMPSLNIALHDRWGQDGSCVVDLRVTDHAGVIFDRGGTSNTPTFPETQVLQIDLDSAREHNQLQETKRLGHNGHGLSNLFASLRRGQQDRVAQEFCRLVPMFGDVVVRPSGPGQHRVQFQDRWNPQVLFEPQQVSDGSILLLAYLMLPYQTPPPEIIAIEEPERGLHPFLMGQLISTLRKLATGAIGPRPVQVLLATHSAELLEFVEPKEVRFFRRAPDTGATIVEAAPVHDPSWLATLREYDGNLGDLWLSGGLGGVPGR